MGVDGTSFVNPIVGLTYAKKVDSLRWAVFLGATVPIGHGRRQHARRGRRRRANTAGLHARSAMDNAMFAVNYFTPIAGGGVAYVDHKLTVQLEATLLQLFRVRGENAPATDSARTNSTAGLHAGYFVIPMLSFGGELRYQRWLYDADPGVDGHKVDIPGVAKDTLTVAIGPRAHFQIGKGCSCGPGSPTPAASTSRSPTRRTTWSRSTCRSISSGGRNQRC